MSKVLSGSIALAKRHGKLEKIAANVIYEGDDFSFDIDIESGCKKNQKHSSSITNIGGKIIGAYAVCVLEDGTCCRNYEYWSDSKGVGPRGNERRFTCTQKL